MKIKEIINNFLSDCKIRDFKVKKIEELGEVSETFLIATEDKNYILKINSADHFEIYQKEAWSLEESKKQGINVPKVIKTSQIDKLSLLIMEYIEGENCSEITNQNIRTESIKQLGNFSKELTKINPTKNLKDLKSIEAAREWFYEGYLQFELNQTIKQDDYLELSSEDRILVIDNLNYLKMINFDFVFCHGDLSLKNLIYSDIQNKFYLIDFGSAETNVKDFYEIMLKWIEVYYEKNLLESEFKLFIQEFLQIDPNNWLDKNIKTIKSFALLYSLDKYRYAHDRNKSLEYEYKKRFLNI